MEVVEIDPRLWRWTTHHPEWKRDVGSLFLETPEAVVLIDPLVPHGEADAERFWRHLDSEVERAARPVHILITVFFHTRSARELVGRYGARLWAHASQRRRVKNRAGEPTDVFELGDPLPGGAAAFDAHRSGEVLYWLPSHRALAAGDVLLGSPFRLCPKSWLPGDTTQEELAAALRPLLDLPVERVLVSHGEPVLENAHAELERILGA